MVPGRSPDSLGERTTFFLLTLMTHLLKSRDSNQLRFWTNVPRNQSEHIKLEPNDLLETTIGRKGAMRLCHDLLYNTTMTLSQIEQSVAIERSLSVKIM